LRDGFDVVLEVLLFDVQRALLLLENRRPGGAREIDGDAQFMFVIGH
jgi:hypothetical protein